MQRSSSPTDPPDAAAPRTRSWLSWGRLLDVLAVAVIAFVAWKWFVAPRAFEQSSKAFEAPHVTYERLDGGGTFALTAHRGRVVFLDFWASWCEPCRLSLPIAEGYAKDHPDVDVVPVNVGEPRIAAATYAKAHDLRGVVLDPQYVSQGYFAIEGLPTMVVVDPQGRIRATWAGFNPLLASNMEEARKRLTAVVN